MLGGSLSVQCAESGLVAAPCCSQGEPIGALPTIVRAALTGRNEASEWQATVTRVDG